MAAVTGTTLREGEDTEGREKSATRISASAIEPIVIRQITAFLRTSGQLVDTLALGEAGPDVLTRMLAGAERLAAEIEQGSVAEQRAMLVDLVERITVGTASLRIELSRASLAFRLLGAEPCHADEAGEPVIIEAPLRIARRGVEAKLVIDGPDNGAPDRTPDPALVKAVARGHVWFEELTQRPGCLHHRDRASRRTDRPICYPSPRTGIPAACYRRRHPLRAPAGRYDGGALEPGRAADVVAGYLIDVSSPWSRRGTLPERKLRNGRPLHNGDNERS